MNITLNPVNSFFILIGLIGMVCIIVDMVRPSDDLGD